MTQRKRNEVWLICGGRDFANFTMLEATLNRIARHRGLPAVIVHGNARGADQMAGRWANIHGVINWPVDAQWSIYGRKAGLMRNVEMAEDFQPDLVVAFPGGTGTRHMVGTALSRSNAVVMCVLANGDAVVTTESHVRDAEWEKVG